MSRRLRIESMEKPPPVRLYSLPGSLFALTNAFFIPFQATALSRQSPGCTVDPGQTPHPRRGKFSVSSLRKLAVGAANDQYKQEADRLARQVMSMPDAQANNASASPGILEEKDKEKALQTKRMVTSSVAASSTPYAQRQLEAAEEEDKETAVQAKRENTALQRQLEMEEEK